ncbi:MAG: ribosomal protein large subunit ribosomal protein [Candidatus Parcubacteria bacterium]|jgi:large subunit ribosomal protein L9
MKVVLLHDVSKIGKKHDIKNVSDGHALNLLIPQGLAEVATPATIKKAEKARLTLEAEKKIQADLLAKNIKSLEAVKVVTEGKASEKGHLFAGIHKEEIVKFLKDQARIDVSADFIKLDHPLKTVGEHPIEVIVGDKKAKFVVVIKAKE